ncbi:hypothetical protein [Streptomyces ipomoeae]|uniref:hypothetical protein n=1 Tax=Streptomyces ipomoeae TaxID=103232 RepID=UPI0011479F46|nr:hypothetical protein [Streptomyces ipomoeae]TQE33144.1 hypothetical protein Sipo7851_21875 [Streptomyces ipomoeae]
MTQQERTARRAAALARTGLEDGPVDPATVQVEVTGHERGPEITVSFAATGHPEADEHAKDLVRGEFRIHEHARPGDGIAEQRLQVRPRTGHAAGGFADEPPF